MEHTVTLSLPPEKADEPTTFRVVTVDALTAYAAASLAETQVEHEEGRQPTLISVASHAFVLGRCGKCQAVVFIGDSVRRRRGSLRCSDCP